ncbi:2-phospho-L-lactate guanylyltransferase [Nakamurella leprariae]|uniref:2-phospho-L-lactate guanylyltransferase n=1 Tax=Nakamurella leprariae TaxID=2803911 RepID=A0A939C1E2_9ACTN|nr:2-phospho-L-lactate guanylyltransferase [Nakamurella leprariae]MBM9467067.1 2-phospho-L-lactate guanylyltransferase [Nakamurella leprariae]
MHIAIRPDRAAGAGWWMVVPIKDTLRGKSRLRIDPWARSRLARAMAVDTAAAVLGAERVDGLVVVAESERDVADLGREIAELSWEPLGDHRPVVLLVLDDSRELNTAITAGVRTALSHGARWVAVVPADLPSAASDEVDRVLSQAEASELTVLADRHGTGTAVLASTTPERLHPRFGVDSFRRHREAGAVPAVLPPDAGLHRDVDELDDLSDVTGLRTRAVLEHLRRLRTG